MLFEAGFYFASVKIQPFVQYATQNFDAASRVDEERLTAGLTYYINGHNNNLKLSLHEDRARRRRVARPDQPAVADLPVLRRPECRN